MYKVLIIPSDEDNKVANEDKKLEELVSKLPGSFNELDEYISKHEFYNSADIYEFYNEECMLFFIQGYEAGIGWLGDGLFYTNKLSEV